ncbi:MAG: STAS domain-containing protein [Polyangiaceae bacterium]|nr:STAS domain-containing protein [Polyangiaceae bacterium]
MNEGYVTTTDGDGMNPIHIINVRAKRLDAMALSALIAEVEPMLADGHGPLALVLDEVEYIDSLGLSVLISLKRKCRDRKLVLVGMRGFVATIARVTHLAEIFDIFPDLASAERVLASNAS